MDPLADVSLFARAASLLDSPADRIKRHEPVDAGPYPVLSLADTCVMSSLARPTSSSFGWIREGAIDATT